MAGPCGGEEAGPGGGEGEEGRGMRVGRREEGNPVGPPSSLQESNIPL